MKHIFLTLLFLSSINIINVFSQDAQDASTMVYVTVSKPANKSINNGELIVIAFGNNTGGYYQESPIKVYTTNDETPVYEYDSEVHYKKITANAQVKGGGTTITEDNFYGHNSTMYNSYSFIETVYLGVYAKFHTGMGPMEFEEQTLQTAD